MITETTSPIAAQLPGSSIRVFKVPSSDRKTEYYVQVIKNRLEHAKTQGITLCNCWNGFNNIPLAIAGVKPLVCKHAEQVFEFLKKEK